MVLELPVFVTAVSVWLEYVQFAIGGMAGEGGMQHVRDVFERAVTAVGLHVSQGANMWEAYREFENALLAGLMVSFQGGLPTDFENVLKAGLWVGFLGGSPAEKWKMF